MFVNISCAPYVQALRDLVWFCFECIYAGIFILFADAGTVVDANVAEKLAQLKNQVATLEKREER